jgi:uncharacterized protein (DUF58 family)
MISRELFHKIRRIELRTSRLVSEHLTGRYRSALKGRGIEFEEVRPYQPGDDVRAIDWKVTARSEVPYIKQFREERELTLHLLVDISGSLAFGSAAQTKRELAVEMAALLAFAALRHNDKVGLTLFTSQIEHSTRVAAGLRHALRIIRDLLVARPESRTTDLGNALDQFRRRNKRRSTVFVISDFLNEGYDAALRRLARQHDVIPIVIRDRAEMELPPGGLLQVTDPETGRHFTFDALSRGQRHTYRELVAAEEKYRLQLFLGLHLDSIELWTGDDVLRALRVFLDRRGEQK